MGDVGMSDVLRDPPPEQSASHTAAQRTALAGQDFLAGCIDAVRLHKANQHAHTRMMVAAPRSAAVAMPSAERAKMAQAEM